MEYLSNFVSFLFPYPPAEKEKKKHQIVLFIEPSDFEFETPIKIGNLFLNRFAVDENAPAEIVKILQLGKKPRLKISKTSFQEYRDDIRQKGMSLVVMYLFLISIFYRANHFVKHLKKNDTDELLKIYS